ncbi:MAG: HDIG domain-containing protein [Armatimonadota bacterium]|nr:HDIG domain-containing protein [Armatimonadota bacterium]MDR7444043.1 HDIG domain-containing protein [Armatimonadota bacterium]MDR7570278.1 HDIG domain-containing protein [Armatimonadota bacterium]MDR7613492.1 HDIG domain-containing protein [Armatimonadota bacterium]
MNREEAWELVCAWVQSPNLRKHLLAVEAAMRAYARRFGEDDEAWGIVGLLHDLDYERHPSLQEHPFVAAEELRRRGVPEAWVRAVLAHGDHTGVRRETLMERALFACDEMVGFVIAVALVKGKSLANVDPESVRRKMKDRAFARGVRREDLVRGAEELGIPLEEHIAMVVEALRPIAQELGLEG